MTIDYITNTFFFNYFINPALPLSYNNHLTSLDHFKVHYGLLGSDIKIRCLVNSSGINVFKWDYEKRKLKTSKNI